MRTSRLVAAPWGAFALPALSSAIVALSLASALIIGCGDKAAPPAPSASAPPEPPKCETVARPEQDKRCGEGDAHCCTLILDATKTSDPTYFDAVARACGTGHEPACQIVRDANRPAAWKLETLSRACTRVGRWTCRSAAQLALVIAPAEVPKAFDAYCKQTGDAELQMAGAVLKCGKLDTNKLNDMKPEVEACKSGELTACKGLAGVDGAAYDLFAQLAWEVRGVPPSTAVLNRVERDYLGAVVDTTGPLNGKVSVSVDEAAGLDKAAVAKAVVAERHDLLERCLTWAMDHDAKTRGRLILDTVVDKSGRIAYSTESKTAGAKNTLTTKTDLVECVRHRLQDAKVADPQKEVVTIGLALDFSH